MPTLTRRERMAIPRVDMPERTASERRWTFDEVNLGLDEAAAITEAQRCLACRRPPCVEGCPVGVQIDRFIPLIAAGELAAAAEIVGLDNLLPAVCGRVCPQEHQCEGACVLARRGDSVAIGHLERFVGDRAPADPPPPAVTTGRRVAIVGSGPAGLACAGDLARAGHEVTVFEALHALGGVLRYGIPEFRLPRRVLDVELGALRRTGVRFVTNVVVGLTETVDDLFEAGFDAVFIGTGAGLPRFLGIPGEELVGVFSANEFLTRVNLMGAHQPGADTPVPDLLRAGVAVFGGGNTAMDAARTALRLGADPVSIVYRRSRDEMPARAEEVEHAAAEGVEFRFLEAPVAFTGTAGRLAGVRVQAMELGEPEPDGRRSPVPIPGAEHTIPLEMAIVAIGNSPNPIIGRTTANIAQGDRGTVLVDAARRTSRPGVYAGGDIVTGGATVIRAMGDGRAAAAAIEEYLASLDDDRHSSGANA